MTTQTDRELLELAAKAYGFGDPESGRFCWTQSEYPRGSGFKGALWNYVGHMDTAELWNSLTDDGDALRLAVKLNLMMAPGFGMTVSGPESGGKDFTEIHGTDPYAATRRAIVRAAAEIGKAMQ